MRYKLPKIIKCCCCVPLEYGVIVSAYVKITIDLLLLTFCLIMFVPLAYKTIYYVGADLTDNTLFRIIVMFVLLLIDITMNIIFIISAKLKNYKLMNIYYHYLIYMFAIYMLYFASDTFSKYYFVGHYIFNSKKWRQMVQDTAFGAMSIGLQYYFILMVRSKLLLVKRNKESDSNERRISKNQRITPEPGTSYTNNCTDTGDQIELKEIVSAPSENFDHKKFDS